MKDLFFSFFGSLGTVEFLNIFSNNSNPFLFGEKVCRSQIFTVPINHLLIRLFLFYDVSFFPFLGYKLELRKKLIRN